MFMSTGRAERLAFFVGVRAALACLLQSPYIARTSNKGLSNMKPILPYLAAGVLFAVTNTVSAGKVSDELSKPGNHELDPVGMVVHGIYRYELTDFSCARDAQLQNEGPSSPEEVKLAKWLAGQAAAHPASKTFTRYANSAFDGNGCFERTAHGIRVYRLGEKPLDVDAPVLPCDPSAVQLGTCAPVPVPAPQPMSAFVPSPGLTEKLINTLGDQPGERFMLQGHPAILWSTTCAQAAQMQGSELSGRDAAFVQWQASQPGNLLTVRRVDYTHSEACYVRTARGIRIWSFEQKDPLDLEAQ
jgi:hypothetical protein